jgi:K+-transporting ATPase ATPase A chain
VVAAAFGNGSMVGAYGSLPPLPQLGLIAASALNLAFGGVGIGLLSMMSFVIIGIFLIGLMAGRTPELLGKKIETREIFLASVAFLLRPLLILGGTAIAIGLSGPPKVGPHTLAEVLFAMASAAANHGAQVGDLALRFPFYRISQALVAGIARFLPPLTMLWLADSLLHKKISSPSLSSLSTEGLFYGGVLFGVIVIFNALAFFPAVALGPLAEHYRVVHG